mgnify:CR=1 FL=1
MYRKYVQIYSGDFDFKIATTFRISGKNKRKKINDNFVKRSKNKKNLLFHF